MVQAVPVLPVAVEEVVHGLVLFLPRTLRVPIPELESAHSCRATSL